jgi:hypothetical protein
VHFLDAWTRLSPFDLARFLLAPACVALAIVLPGRRIAALAALGLAAAALIHPDPGSIALAVGWSLLWLALAAFLTRAPSDPPSDPSTRRGGIESGAVGLLLGLAVLTLLVAALARADLDDRVSREASAGLLLITLGLVHLMLRRHVLRAGLAFGAMGMGLDRMVRIANAQQLPGGTVSAAAVWFASVIAIAMVARIARLRLEAGGGAWVSGAHDLHD